MPSRWYYDVTKEQIMGACALATAQRQPTVLDNHPIVDRQYVECLVGWVPKHVRAVVDAHLCV
jgi:hypothetical protein